MNTTETDELVTQESEQESEREERAGIRLTATDRRRLRAIAAHWYPDEQRKQSEAVRRLIREAFTRLETGQLG